MVYFSFVVYTDGQTMSALIDAYREYLDRMIEQSDDLHVVDQYTVPMDVDITSPTVLEWADFA